HHPQAQAAGAAEGGQAPDEDDRAGGGAAGGLHRRPVHPARQALARPRPATGQTEEAAQPPAPVPPDAAKTGRTMATVASTAKPTPTQPRMSPASARPAPCSPVRRIWLRATWPSTTAGMAGSGHSIICATPQTRLAMAMPLVFGGASGAGGPPPGRSMTTES